MSWYSRTWVSCARSTCDREVLRSRAEGAGWLLREGRRALCPLHRQDTRGLDVAERAAGEREER